MTDPLFPFEVRLHRDAFSVHKVHHVSIDDPVTVDPDTVKAWHLWRQPDSLTAPTKYKDYQRNADNTAWLFVNAWYIDQEYANGQVPVADVDGYLMPGIVEGGDSGGGPSTIDIEDEGGLEGSADTIDFVGAGVSVGFAAGKATVTIPGGSGSIPSWLLDHPDAPPTSADADDDEFGDDTGQSGPVNGLDAKWSWVNQGTSTIAFANHAAVLVPQDAAANLRLLAQAVPVGNWKIRAKVHITGDSDNDANIGLFVSAGTGATDNLAVIYVNSEDAGWVIYTQQWNDYTAFGSTTTSWSALPRSTPLYFEIEYDGTNLIFRLSYSGHEGTYIAVRSETAAAHVGTPSHYGIVTSQNATAVDAVMAVDWFRRVA